MAKGWYYWLTLFWSVLALPAVVCAQEKPVVAASREPVVIAAIFALSGLAARNNQPLVDMVRYTVAQVNRDGGVLGRRIQLEILDNKSNAIGSLEAAQKAIAVGATAVIGAHWSSHSLAMAPLLQDAGIPMIAPASTNPEVTRGRSYVFRVCFLDSRQGEAMARFVKDQLGIETVAVLHNIDERYSSDLAGFFLADFIDRGGRVVLNSSYRGDATDFSDSIDELLKLAPQAIYIPGYTRDTALFMKQARKRGVTAVFLGGDGWDLLNTYVASEVDGSYQTVLWHPEVPYPQSKVAQDIYREQSKHEVDNLTTPLAYDAVMLLVDAIKRAGTSNRAKIREALAATRDFPGAAGPLSFDDNGDPKDKDVIIIQYIQGRTRFVTAVKASP